MLYICTYGGGEVHEVFCVRYSLLTSTLTLIFAFVFFLIPVLLIIIPNHI